MDAVWNKLHPAIRLCGILQLLWVCPCHPNVDSTLPREDPCYTALHYHPIVTHRPVVTYSIDAQFNIAAFLKISHWRVPKHEGTSTALERQGFSPSGRAVSGQ